MIISKVSFLNILKPKKEKKTQLKDDEILVHYEQCFKG